MNNLSIQKTDATPEIDFRLNGDLKIFGRSLPEDVHKFYGPIIDWVKELKTEKVKVNFKLEYLNTASTKKMLNLLSSLEENENIAEIVVNWFYETDDIDMEDLGEIYKEELKRIKFHFIEGVDIF